ncbi:MAG: tripartite tricarboxylate transporter permease [Planctomycetes bacterium]|nr:tripartite tricarboxylate transporter permease [Planctomycetota bacterium]
MMQESFYLGLANVMSPFNILSLLSGTAVGILVGAMPGLSATMAIAILVPVTLAFPPDTGICLLTAIYLSAMYGGSVAAILIRTPGTAAAAATVLDGYPLARRGYAGKALGISLTASFIGGLMSSMALLTVAPVLGRVALQFGPVEMAAVAVLGLTIIASLSQESTVKGLLAGSLGLLLSCVGMDAVSGSARFTMGTINLFSGIPFTVALIGLFSIPQVLRLLERDEGGAAEGTIQDSVLPDLREIRSLLPVIFRSGGIGVVTGLIPGTGGDTACWFAYNEAKRFASPEQKKEFGTGSLLGIAAPEAANNAVVGGSLIPTISLGIPGSSSTAVLLGGLMGHGIMPGPTLMSEHADVAYTLLWAVFVANFFMLGLGLGFTRLAVYVTRIPNKVLGTVIVIFCVIGAFAINTTMFDVYLMLAFGLLGYVMDKLRVPVAPLVVGLILGQMLEVSVMQSLLLSDGSWLVFFREPISLGILCLAALSLLSGTPAYPWIKRTLQTARRPKA